MLTLDAIRDAAQEIAPNYSIRSVKLFGSFADGDATEKSDVDIIIEPFGVFTLLDLISFQQELSERLHTDVDVVEEESLPGSSLIIEKVVGIYERQKAS